MSRSLKLFLECLIPSIGSDAADALFVLRMLWNTACTWSASAECGV